MVSLLKFMLILLVFIVGLIMFIFFPSEELDNIKIETYSFANNKNIYVITKVDKTSDKENLNTQVNNVTGNADFHSAKIDPNSNLTEEKKQIIEEVCAQYGFDPFLMVAIGAEETNFTPDSRESCYGTLTETYFGSVCKGTDMSNFRESTEAVCKLFKYFQDVYGARIASSSYNKTYLLLCMYGQGEGAGLDSPGGNDMPYAYPQMMALYSYYKSGNPKETCYKNILPNPFSL